MKHILSILALTITSLTTTAQQHACYNIIPLPRSIQLQDTVNCYPLTGGCTISFPQTEAMERNATYLATYLDETCGIAPTLSPATSDKKARKGQPANITLDLFTEKERASKLKKTIGEGLSADNADAYCIQVTGKGITLKANTDEGIFRAIQTLRKSLTPMKSDTVWFPLATIKDQPRFAYRGAMLDCARHFFPASYIKQYIDILALHGVNQFHWHITDDQGWRFEVKSMPELAQRGQFRRHTIIGNNVGLYNDMGGLYDDTPETGFYTQEQLRDIVAYAAERYINIIPEIDLPGHMVAALSVYPNLGCTGGPYEVLPYWGVADDILCAGNPQTIEFLKNVLGELIQVFPSKYIHIGGDESPRVRWQHCPKCQAKMKELGLTKEAQLQTYINKEMDAFLTANGRQLIGWDETLEGGLSENAIVMSWRGYEGGTEAARQHHRVIMTPTSHCYIDYYQLRNHDAQPHGIGGYLPLSKVYSMEPLPEGLTAEEQQYIWGAQCNLWTEYVLSPDHIEYMLLPRLAAMSEVQWMAPEAKDFKDFEKRLHQLKRTYKAKGYHYCRQYE